jgi:hypothetical protein
MVAPRAAPPAGPYSIRCKHHENGRDAFLTFDEQKLRVVREEDLPAWQGRLAAGKGRIRSVDRNVVVFELEDKFLQDPGVYRYYPDKSEVESGTPQAMRYNRCAPTALREQYSKYDEMWPVEVPQLREPVTPLRRWPAR